jgi:hypothetical protein
LELEIVARFLSEIVRFLSCSALWCAVVQMANASFGITQTAYVIRPTPIFTDPLRYVAARDEETLVITTNWGRQVAVPSSRDFAVYREIAKVGSTGMDEPVRVRIPVTPRSTWTVDPLSEGFFVTGTGWWYATLDDRDDAAATTFVKSDGSRVTYVRPPPPGYTDDTTDTTHSNSWQTIVIPGEKPRALELTYRVEETIAREVDWSGASRSWRLPLVSYERVSRMVAQPLPDGRIALLSNHNGLSLYLLADEGHVDAVTLRNLRIQQFDAAIDGAGRIAIVAARNDTGTIDAAIIDPAHPDHAEWAALRHDVRVTGQFGGVHVVTTPDGFAAAWINELDGRLIEATDVDRRGHGGPVVEVGRASSRGPAAFLGVQAKQDELLFWWDDGEHLFQRRLPVSLKGYAILNDLAQRFCGKAEAHPEERPHQ